MTDRGKELYESLREDQPSIHNRKRKWNAKDNDHFLQNYEPYIVHDWKEGYFAYDPLKSKYKKLKKSIIEKTVVNSNKLDSLKSFDEELLFEITKVSKFIKCVLLAIDEDISILRDEMSLKSSSSLKQFNENQRNSNFELSLRSLYVKIQHLEEFYQLNYYCIIKTAKKFNKLLMLFNTDPFDNGDDRGEATSHPLSAIPHSTRQFLQKWHQIAHKKPLDAAQAIFIPHFEARREELQRCERLFASTPDHLWKETSSGSFFFVKFMDKWNKIQQVKSRCIETYSSHFRKNYGELAEFELRYVKNKEHSSKDSKFFLGLKFGLIGCTIMWLMTDTLTTTSEFDFWSQSGLFVYTLIGNLLLYRLCWAGNIFVWSKYDINYIAVLELSNQQPNLLLVANQSATLLMWYFVNLLIYCRSNMPDSYWFGTYLSYGCPFILLIVSILYQIYESVFMFGNEHVSRGCFGVKVFRNMALAPFSPLRFREIYVADVLTSFNRVIADSLYASCWILSGSFSSPLNVDGSLATNTDFGTSFLQCTNSNMLLTVSIVQLIPLITRTLQCFRAIYDMGFKMYPQGYNSIKYMLSMAVVVVALVQSSNKPLYYFFICSATLYKWWWDCCMDWGLFERMPRSLQEWLDIGSYGRKRIFLRENLMYPSIIVYYIAIVVDLILRFLWVLSLLPPSTLGNLVGHELNFFLGSVEIVRRSFWAVLRIEYEHLKLLNQRAPGFLGNTVLHNRNAMLVVEETLSSKKFIFSGVSHNDSVSSMNESISTFNPLAVDRCEIKL